MGVSGEFRYFGPAFSSVERVRPVKAMTLPASLLMGNITRLRNLEYIAETTAFGFRIIRVLDRCHSEKDEESVLRLRARCPYPKAECRKPEADHPASTKTGRSPAALLRRTRLSA